MEEVRSGELVLGVGEVGLAEQLGVLVELVLRLGDVVVRLHQRHCFALSTLGFLLWRGGERHALGDDVGGSQLVELPLLADLSARVQSAEGPGVLRLRSCLPVEDSSGVEVVD